MGHSNQLIHNNIKQVTKGNMLRIRKKKIAIKVERKEYRRIGDLAGKIRFRRHI